jgi:Spore photoproduct lyase
MNTNTIKIIIYTSIILSVLVLELSAVESKYFFKTRLVYSSLFTTTIIKEERTLMFKPKEIIIHAKVAEDPFAERIVDQCRGVPVKYVENGRNDNIVRSSKILNSCGAGMRKKILAGKQVLYVAPAGNNAVDQFEMPDSRLLCPHFDRLKLASNGCPYACDWCYLKATYRGAFPYMTVYAEHDKIKAKISKRLLETDGNVIFNSGELADSLALDHLTGAVAEFIPFFAASGNGYLFTLTKSDNVNGILDLEHNGHTIPAWSLNDDKVSRTYEIGAPTFERRLMAAQKVQNAGYSPRIRLDPIVPFNGWKESYADNTKLRGLVNRVQRFERGLYTLVAPSRLM